jgi:hypothetical protein
MALKIDSIPTELIDNYLNHKCGFFVGAGLSRNAGYPDWQGLLTGLIKKAEQNHLLAHDRATECRKLAKDPSKFLMLAEEMKDVLGVEFKTYLEETFGDDEIDPRLAHDLLVTLKRNNFIITTNYDLLIEKAFVNNRILQTAYKYYEANAIQRQLYLRKFFLLKAHGDAKSAAEHIVLTDKDYRNLLYREPGYQSVLQSIFTMYSVIFIGCSLQDPELRLLLNYINAAFPEGGVPHYALMSTEHTNSIERSRWKKDYNMKIIPISPDNNYEDIDIFLKILHEKEN